MLTALQCNTVFGFNQDVLGVSILLFDKKNSECKIELSPLKLHTMNTLKRFYSSIHFGSIIVGSTLLFLLLAIEKFDPPVQAYIVCSSFLITAIFAIVIFLEVCSMAVERTGTFWIVTLVASIIVGLLGFYGFTNVSEYLAYTTESPEVVHKRIIFSAARALIIFTVQITLYTPLCVRMVFFEEKIVKKQKQRTLEKRSIFR